MNAIGIRRFRQLRKIIRSLRRGSSMASSCVAAQIDATTLWRWRKSNPKLDNLIHNIVDSRIQMVEDALFKKAMEGDVGAQRLFLTNRAPNRWKDRSTLINNNIQTNVSTHHKDPVKKYLEEVPTPTLKKMLESMKRLKAECKTEDVTQKGGQDVWKKG